MLCWYSKLSINMFVGIIIWESDLQFHPRFCQEDTMPCHQTSWGIDRSHVQPCNVWLDNWTWKKRQGQSDKLLIEILFHSQRLVHKTLLTGKFHWKKYEMMCLLWYERAQHLFRLQPPQIHCEPKSSKSSSTRAWKLIHKIHLKSQ